MSGLLLDTNVLSELTRIKPEPRVTEWLAGVAVERLHVSVLTLGKIRKGIALLPAGNRRAQFQEWFGSVLESWFSERVLPVDRNIADRWGLLTARAKVAGTPLAVVDATARGNRCAAQPDGRHAQQQALLRRWRAPLQSVGRGVTS
jgi:predicted nucleic acid-binding protein